MITPAHGNLLEDDVEALVNTVNTVGIMGKGIALQFKRAYPEMFADYARAAKRGELELGRMHVWATGLLTGPRIIINFPTKGHWRSASRLADVERGLDDLVMVIREHGIQSVAVPPLGCGNGGLDWRNVEPIIQAKLSVLSDVEVHLYSPDGAPVAAAMLTVSPAPAMTPGRAALIAAMARYARAAMGDASLIETQKLTYFLQAAGEPLRLNFAAHHYGPYADNLRHALQHVEGHYLGGFGDGSTPVREAEPLTVLPGAESAADRVLATQPGTAARIERVMELVEGFESAYALELLATVHWILEHGSTNDTDDVVAAVQAWSPRKGRMFTPEHIKIAKETLERRGWARRPAESR